MYDKEFFSKNFSANCGLKFGLYVKLFFNDKFFKEFIIVSICFNKKFNVNFRVFDLSL
jgi:hypothetical protein